MERKKLRMQEQTKKCKVSLEKVQQYTLEKQGNNLTRIFLIEKILISMEIDDKQLKTNIELQMVISIMKKNKNQPERKRLSEKGQCIHYFTAGSVILEEIAFKHKPK